MTHLKASSPSICPFKLIFLELPLARHASDGRTAWSPPTLATTRSVLPTHEYLILLLRGPRHPEVNISTRICAQEGGVRLQEVDACDSCWVPVKARLEPDEFVVPYLDHVVGTSCHDEGEVVAIGEGRDISLRRIVEKHLVGE